MIRNDMTKYAGNIYSANKMIGLSLLFVDDAICTISLPSIRNVCRVFSEETFFRRHVVGLLMLSRLCGYHCVVFDFDVCVSDFCFDSITLSFSNSNSIQGWHVLGRGNEGRGRGVTS